MKKITLMILVSLMSFFAYAQLPVEHFDDPWTGTPAAPPNWVVINEFGPIYTWVQTTPGNTAQPPFGGTGYSAYLQKENVAPAAAIPSDWLITKEFPMTANAELKFQSRLTVSGDIGGVYKLYMAKFAPGETVEVTDFTGPNGVLLTTYTEAMLDPANTQDWQEKIFNIPANAALWPVGGTVRIAFVMQGDDKDRWFLDDIQVAAACVAPTTPVVSATTIDTATLSWTNASATSWEVEVVPGASVPLGAGVTYNGTLPYVRTGLLACTEYKYYVRAKCADGGLSAWVGPVFFKTKCLGETCASPLVIPPGNQSVSGNTANSIDFYEGISGTGCNSTGNYLAGNDVVYTYTPNATGNYSVTLTNTGGPAGMFIYSSCANIGVACLNGGVATATVPVNLPAFSMTAGTTYYIVISSNGTPQTTPYVLTIQQVFCPQPTAGTATGVTGTTATLGWTAGTVGATSWQMVVQPAGGGLPTTGTTSTTVATNSNTVGGTSTNVPFTPATAYEFYVRESCAGGTFSIWAGPFLFSTTQVPATLNLIENFDGGPHGFTLGNGTQVNKWVVGTATSNSPTRSLYISNDNGATNSYTVAGVNNVHAYRDIQMPATVGQLSFSFDWRAFGESCCDYISVWMVPATFTPTPGTQITAAAGRTKLTGNLNIASNWTTFNTIITPTGWDNQLMRLVFEWHNDISDGSAPPGAIDNINLSKITCPQPTALVLNAINPTTATVNWTAPAIIPASYDVYVANTATPVPTAATAPTQNVPGTTANIALTANTIYYVWVRANCGPTDKSFWTGPIRFATPQNPAPMDYTENFDGGPHNFTLSNDIQTNKWVVGGATFNSAANSLYISNDNGVSNTYDTALQSVVHAYRDIQIPAAVPSGQGLLQFNWKAVAEAGDYVRVWVVPVTFTPTPGTQITAAASGGVQVGGNLTGSPIWATSNNVVTIPAAWNNTPRRVIFEWFNNGFTGVNPPAAIDNVTFKVITCPAPTALVVGSLTTTTATINWTAPASVPANYDYYISTTAVPPTDGTTPGGTVSGATPTATIPGLTDSTNYNVWIRSNCGGAAGTSFWVGPLNFNTPQIPASMPYVQNFDGADNPAYTLNNGTQVNKWVVGTATSNSPTRSLYISNDNGVTNNYTIDNATSVVQAYRDIQLPPAIPTNQVLFQFDWKALGESCCDYLRVWIVPVTFTPTPGVQITAAASGGIQIPGNINLNNSNTWTTVNNVVNSTGWAGGSIRRIIFEWRNDQSVGPVPGAAIDNVTFAVITCSAPSGLALGPIDASNATFTWTASTPPAASYDYYLTTSPVAPVAGTVPTGNTTGTSLTLSGLPDSTNYYLWIRSNCGATDGTSFWIGGLNFNTPQIPVELPYVQNFDGAGNPGFTYSTGTQPNKWVVGAATFNSPANSLYISNDNGVTNNYTSTVASTVHAYRDVVIPGTATNLDFSFNWKNVGETGDYIRVWRVPLNFNPVAGTAITALAGTRDLITTVNLFNQANWQNASYVVPISPAIAGTTQRFVFEWVNNAFTGTSPGAIDNIDIKLLTCPKPTTLTATAIGMTSATLGWTEVGTATAWEVYVVETGQPAPGTATVGTAAPTNPFVYNTNLEPGTLYQYYVRSVCGPNDLSRWTGPFNFNTNVCEIVDQCPVNFILTDNGNNGWGTTTMTVTQNGIFVGTLGPQLPTGNGPVTVTLPLCKGIPYDVFFNTGGTNPQQCGLQIVNPYNGQTVFQRIAGTLNGDQNTVIYTGLAYCSDITCPQPTELVSESIVNAPGATTLSWTPGGTETQWEVIVQAQGAGFPDVAPVTSVIVDEPNHVLENLPTGVPYEFYVRAICSPTDKSFWSGALRFSMFTPPACADVVVTDPDLEIIAPDTEYIVCPGEPLCVDFDASYYIDAAETTSYEVEGIPFLPPFPTLGGTPMPIGSDDIWSPKIPLPFEFCFMGDVYNAAQVGANGVISFNANYAAGAFNAWAFTQTIPNTAFPILNAIYGVYQDTDPRPDLNTWDNPNINYQVLGNYPCRALVVSFNELAQYGCSDNSPTSIAIGPQSSQIVIYEITNIIEVYVKRRVACVGHNSGSGLIGLQNAAGTVSFVPPGRNTGPWTAIEEAWRFTPNGAVTTATFEWLKDGVPYSTNTAINVCADAGTTVMTARASYLLCNGNSVVRESDFTLRVQEQIIPANDPVDLTKCGNGEDVTFDLTVAVADVFTDATGYNFTYYPTEQDAIDETNVIAAPTAFVTNATVTVWVRIMKDDLPCFITKSFDVIISNVPPVFTGSPDISICDGTSTTLTVTPDATEDLTGATYSWTLDGAALPDVTSSITVSADGEYVVTVNKGGCVGTATTIVTVVPMPVADVLTDVTACDAYTLPALSAGSNYYTAAGGTGTALSAGEVIGVDANAGQLLGAGIHTIFVYAVSPTLAACTDESSFVVTINQTPVIDSTVADVAACDAYILPALSADENYYTATGGPDGAGTLLNAGDAIATSQTIFVYEETGTTPNCSAEASFVLTVTPTPVADVLAPVVACDSYTLLPLSAGNTYYTATGGPNGTGTALSAGDVVTSGPIYVYAAALDNATCSAESIFDLTITATPQFNLGGPYVTCVASNLTVSVNAINFNLADATYEWTVNGAPAGDNSSSIVGTEFGDYEVKVTVGTCFDIHTVKVSQDTELVELSVTDICTDNVYYVEVNDVNGSFNIDTASYSWSGPEGFTSTERVIQPLATGEYVVTVTTADGCISIDSIDVTSTACLIPRGISPNGDNMNDSFDLTALGVRKISIFNRYGQEVYSKNDYTNEWIGQGSNGDELPSGTYYYMVERNNGESRTGWVYINRQD